MCVDPIRHGILVSLLMQRDPHIHPQFPKLTSLIPRFTCQSLIVYSVNYSCVADTIVLDRIDKPAERKRIPIIGMYI